jgi:hypothetical protein
MKRLPILPIKSKDRICLPDSLLPQFYMEDYTILGLQVENLAVARLVLETNGFRTVENHGYIELSINQKDQLPQVIQLLNSNHISCVIADIVDQVYQG